MQVQAQAHTHLQQAAHTPNTSHPCHYVVAPSRQTEGQGTAAGLSRGPASSQVGESLAHVHLQGTACRNWGSLYAESFLFWWPGRTSILAGCTAIFQFVVLSRHNVTSRLC